MKGFSLDGRWELRRAGDNRVFAATVPGCVHADLLRAGEIPDPLIGDNELKVQWIGESTWVYRRAFRLPTALAHQKRILLRAEGLDTLAAVIVNGREIGRADNMHRTWEWDVTGVVRPGINDIEVRFDPIGPYLAQQGARDPLPAWNEYCGWKHRGWLRKMHCNLGWDWAPVLVSCGIWRSIGLRAVGRAAIADVRVGQEHAPGWVTLRVGVGLETVEQGEYRAYVSVSRHNKTWGTTEIEFSGAGQASAAITLENPELWWPAGMGRQPLYDLRVELRDARGAVLDTWHRRIGLRTLKLVREPDSWGESFRFEANGVPFFAKGTNWVPPLPYPVWPESELWKSRLDDAVAAHMNMIRVWGGGYFPPDEFYDYCDRIGLTVWQDLLFACGPYPLYDETFRRSVEAEVRDNVRRLHHHASIALWCGNNELEPNFIGPERGGQRMAFADYDAVFNKLFPTLIAEHAPDSSYWPASPLCPDKQRTDVSERSGDIHIWEIWFSDAPFERYRNYHHRFVSEFGFQSMPHAKTVAEFTPRSHRSLNSPVMVLHQRSGPGNQQLLKFLMEWFRLPERTIDLSMLTQLVQANCLKIGVEHFRRAMPRTMGTLYWQLNDCWPCMSWSSIDYAGRWKAAHWFAKRFFAPVLVSGVEDTDKGTVDVWLTSELRQRVLGVVRWYVVALDGAELGQGQWDVLAEGPTSFRVGGLDASAHISRVGKAGFWVWLEFLSAGVEETWNVVFFDRPRQMELLPSGLKTRVESGGRSGRFTITVTCEKPALWVCLDTRGFDTRFSDNFRPLIPGKQWRVTAETSEKVSVSAFRRALIVRDVLSTYA